jgi:LysM repeat protein
MKGKGLLFALCTLMLFWGTTAFAQPEKAAQFQEHKVLAGETASTISDHFHVKKKDFLMLNNFPPDIKLTPGTVVLIKQLKDGEKAVEENWNDNSEASTVYSGPAITPSYSDSRTHVGKASSSTSSNNEQPATTSSKKTEKAESSSYSSSSSRESLPPPSSPPAKTTTSAAPTPGPGGVQYTVSDDGYHVVEKGQTFYRIALTYHLTVDKLKELNNMSNTNISVGQKLKVK